MSISDMCYPRYVLVIEDEYIDDYDTLEEAKADVEQLIKNGEYGTTQVWLEKRTGISIKPASSFEWSE